MAGKRMLAARPTAIATLSVIPILRTTTVQFPWKATSVASSTTGLMTGAASMNVTAA